MKLREFVILALGLTAFSAKSYAAVNLYQNPGTANPIIYNFRAVGGDVVAFFSGKSAVFSNTLGIRVGKIDYFSTLNSQISTVGESFNFGYYAAGTEIEILIAVNGSKAFYSDVTLNTDATNHLYSVDYLKGTLAHNLIPSGTYVGFEDIAGGGDRDYNDFTAVFTGIASGIPEISTWAMFIIGFASLAFVNRRRNRTLGRCAMGGAP